MAKTYIQPKSLCINLMSENLIATSPTIGVKNNPDEWVTDLENDATSNRRGFGGGPWDNME